MDLANTMQTDLWNFRTGRQFELHCDTVLDSITTVGRFTVGHPSIQFTFMKHVLLHVKDVSGNALARVW